MLLWSLALDVLSAEILSAFEENANKIGMSNPMDKAEDVIDVFSDFTSAAEKLGKAGGTEGMGRLY